MTPEEIEAAKADIAKRWPERRRAFRDAKLAEARRRWRAERKANGTPCRRCGRTITRKGPRYPFIDGDGSIYCGPFTLSTGYRVVPQPKTSHTTKRGASYRERME